MTHGDFAHLLDLGLARENNEDAALSRQLDDGRVLLVVADGVGGAAAGEVASAMAVAAIERVMASTADSDPVAALAEALTVANRAIFERALAEPAMRGMATTGVVAIIDGARAWVTHTGDSRAYLFDGRRLVALTADHRMVADMVRAGQISEAQARAHPYRNVITRALGMERALEIDAPVELELAAGNVLLLCTDGLSDPVEEVEIADILAAGGTAHELARRLVERALASGGPDNIGVALYGAR
jgi:protein phosphatase